MMAEGVGTGPAWDIRVHWTGIVPCAQMGYVCRTMYKGPSEQGTMGPGLGGNSVTCKRRGNPSSRSLEAAVGHVG
jgi:hypothetical protein